MNIAISVGHGKSKNGGYDSGAVGGNYHEFRLCKEVGKFLKEELDKYDCTSELINYDGSIYLYDRIQYIKKRKFDLALELHMNAFNKKAAGSECYYKFKSTSGKNLAGAISKSIAEKMGSKNRGAKIRTYESSAGIKDYFGFVREVPCESLLVETLFIDNKADRDKMITSHGQKKCAEAIAGAIADFYSLKLKDSEPSHDTSLKAGDRVIITAQRYATGEKIPAWVKRKIHSIKKISLNSSGRKQALLKEINSYVFCDGLSLDERPIKLGDTVTIKQGAIYGGLSSSRGTLVPKSQLSPKKHIVSAIKTNMGIKEALLGDISSWVSVDFLEEGM